MWKPHYWFSSINFNSTSALRISILLLSSLKDLINFFKIQPSLGINNNIILKMNISMSKNTESIDMTKLMLHFYTVNNINILLRYSCSISLFRIKYKKMGDLGTLQYYFSFAKKIERAKVQYSTRI